MSQREWVAVVEVKQRAGGAQVYNFEVEGNHNYYVGDVGVLVHNACKWDPNVQNYGVGRATPLNHVFDRHNYNTSFPGVSKFKEGFSRRDIVKLSKKAAKNGTPSRGDILYDCKRKIGYDSAGNPTNFIVIHLNGPWIRSMYPF